MGDSMPPPATFDLVDSFARRRGTDVEIVLAEPATELAGSATTVLLAKGGTTIEGTGRLGTGEHGRRLTVHTPRAGLADGIWSLTVRHDDGSLAPLAARLLVQGERPLVLLWGATDSGSKIPARRSGHPVTKQAARAGGRALDRVLAVLPPERATAVRERSRKAARRVLG